MKIFAIIASIIVAIGLLEFAYIIGAAKIIQREDKHYDKDDNEL